MAAIMVSFIPCSPCAQSLHYGVGCFEGMKAYAGSEDGLGRLFRPDMNMARLQRSSKRLMLADFDAEVSVCYPHFISRGERRPDMFGAPGCSAL
jgi:branched-subunit amino acid aminotransferase/4-amino-4-deoxychorismate lyase